MRSGAAPLRATLALLALCLAFPAHASAAPRLTTAPRFTLPALHGKASLDSLRGRVVLVDFWASWCEPCKRSFPWLAEMHHGYSGKGLTIVAINLDKDRALADAFLDRYPAPFTVAFDPTGATAETYKVAAMPTSFLIGRSGEILYSHAGFDPRKSAEYESRIREACGP